MYFQTAYTLIPSVQCVDPRRLLDLQHYKQLMEKHHQLCGAGLDPFEPLRRLAMAERRARNPEKPLTSFRINDILSRESESQSRGKLANLPSGRSVPSVKTIHQRSRHSSEESLSPVKRPRTDVSESETDNSASDKDDVAPKRIVRPWNICPSSGETKDENAKAKTKLCNYNNNKETRHLHFNASKLNLSPSSSSSQSSVSSDETRATNNDVCFQNALPAFDAKRIQALKKQQKSKPKHEYDSDVDVEIDVECCDDEEDESDVSFTQTERGDVSPLDALVAMSSKTFMGLGSFDDRQNQENDHQSGNQLPKKKRKTRTAFTNQQIYELEKRFILQKYLTPSDRDEIAAKLGLSCAQVITWFQNRRAKFKRDIEELKNDVVATSPKGSDSNEI